MIRTLLFAVGGIMLAGIIHIVSVLQVPAFAPQDTWSRIADIAPLDRFLRIKADGEDDAVRIPMLDPMMEHAVCRYSLETGAVRMRATLPDTYWSVALYNRRGENIFSINDRAVATKDLDMLVLTPDQLAIIRENPPEELQDILIIETDDMQGFALLHVFNGDTTMTPEIHAGLDAARCEIRPF